MAEKTPVRINYDGSNNAIGFAEYQAADFIGIDDGGTGAVTASAARTALGIAIGVDVQAYDSDLATIAGLSQADGAFLVSNGSAWTVETGATARTSLGLGTSDSPTFNGLSVTNNVTISGNLTVDGTQTILNTETLTVDDNTIVLNNNVTGSPTENAGIEIERGSSANKSILWDETNDYWTFGSDTLVAGAFTGTLSATSTIADGVTATTQSASDNSTKVATTAYVDAQVSSNEDIDDRVAALLTDSATSGIDINYDDNGNQLTLSVDLSEITEAFTDKVGGMVDGGTESFIDVAYDDTNDRLNFTVATKDEDDMSSNSATHLPTQQSVKAYVDTETANVASDTMTFTNKTFDVEGTGNSISNIDVANLKSGVLDTDISSVSGSDDTLASAKAIKTYVDAQIDTKDALSELSGDSDDVTEGSTNLYFTNARAISALSAGTGITISGAGAIATTITQYTDSDAQAVSINNLVEDTTPQLGGNLDINSSNITGTGNIDTSGDITITSTADTSAAGPIINLVRDSASPADADYLGQIKFKGDDDGGASTVYAKITGKIDDASAGTEDGLIEFATIKNGSSNIAARLKTTNFQLLNGTGLEVAGNATITGDLTVNGTTTTIDTTNTVVSDSLIELANGTSGTPANDAGLVIERGSADNAFIGYDESEDKFKLGTGSFTGASTGNLTITTGTLLANLEGNVTGNVTGNVSGTSGSTTGNAATATALETARTIAGQSFDGTGNITIASTDLSDTASIILTTNTKTLTNKTIDLTDNTVTGTLAEFQTAVSDATLVDLDDSQTLTNKTINLENNTVIVEYAVTVAGGKFVIDGQSQATISFRPGVVHRFDLSDSSVATHPFVLSETSEGTAYTTGRTASGTQGQSGAYIEFTVNAATPDILYYYCSSHSGMGGTITVFGSAYGDSDVQAYLSAGTGITLSGSGVIATTITQYADSDVQAYLSAGTGITLSGSGEIASSITQYADSDVQSYLSGGTGVTMSGSGEFSIGQAVATTSDVTFADVAATGNVTITGNLDVNGTTTTLDTTNSTIADRLIELGTGTTGTPANDMGIVLERGSSDNAFIGWDESADKFIVGTGSFTGASTGNLTISTGTLLANLEGNVTGNVTGNADTATALATGRTIGMTGDVVWTSASFDGSGNVTGTAAIQSDAVETAMVNANVISGQSAYSGSVDTSNDFVLIYDHSTTSLKKIAVSDLNAASGAGTMSDFTVAGDSGSSQNIADGNTLTIAGGTNLSSVASGTDTITINLDTETIQDIVGAMLVTNGSHSGISFAYQDSDADGAIDATVTATGTVTEAFKTISVSGQSDVVADGATDTLTFAAGANITLTTDASSDEITIAATGGAANAFSTLAVSGQSNVVADAATDTLTLVAGTGMTLTTDASADSITFAASSAGGGSLPFTEFDGSSDPIVLSSQSTGGALPVTLAGGSSDPIAMTSTQQTMTSYADADDDTKIEVERSTDNDTVHVKAGGTDVITATSSGVTITNLTVTGTSTQANELKITDTLFELNADGGSLTTDAGMIVERGSTGDNAAFIWDESADAWIAGTTATDGSAAANLTVTAGDLIAKTQNQSDNSTKVATTAYVDTATSGISSDTIKDADNDTKIQAEASSDADELVFTTGGQERAKMDNNFAMSARGGFFTHNLTMHASETYTVAATEGTVAAGPLDIQGTVDVQGSLVVV